MKKAVLTVLACGISATAGCVSWNRDRQIQETRRQVELKNLSVSINRIEERVDGLLEAQQQIFREVEQLRAERRQQAAVTDARLAELDRGISAAGQEREKLRQEIVGTVSTKIAGMLKKTTPTVGVQHGREHVVQPGETLSEIARAYGATVESIVRGNNLKDANAIRAGQALFIPE